MIVATPNRCVVVLTDKGAPGDLRFYEPLERQIIDTVGWNASILYRTPPLADDLFGWLQQYCWDRGYSDFKSLDFWLWLKGMRYDHILHMHHQVVQEEFKGVLSDRWTSPVACTVVPYGHRHLRLIRMLEHLGMLVYFYGFTGHRPIYKLASDGRHVTPDWSDLLIAS